MEIQNDNIERVVSNISLQITFKNRYDADYNIVTVNVGEWVQILANLNGNRVVIKGKVHRITQNDDAFFAILIRNNTGIQKIPVTDIIDINFNKNYSYPMDLDMKID